MAFEENGERINDLKLILGRVAEIATLFDDDGILIRFMNGQQQGNGIRDVASANQLISQVQFNGLTPLGTQLDQKVGLLHLHLTNFLRALACALLVLRLCFPNLMVLQGFHHDCLHPAALA